MPKRIQIIFLALGIFTFHASCNLYKSTKKEPDSSTLRSYYEFLDTTNPDDGLPSECDCDYHKIGLFLMQDSSFIMKNQKGRLQLLSMDIKYGTWEIHSSKILRLHIDSTMLYYGNDTIKERGLIDKNQAIFQRIFSNGHFLGSIFQRLFGFVEYLFQICLPV